MKVDSIFKSCIRAFFVTVCIMIGIGVGFIPLIASVMSIGAVTTERAPEIQYGYTHEILPNAKGERKSLDNGVPAILVINIDGIIGTELLNRYTIEKQLTEAREGILKDRIKGIFLRINSPGGRVVDAAEIMNHLNKFKKQHNIPIYAHVDGLCASGAMYISTAADKIYANDVSLVGNVGVISPPFFNLSKVLENWGIETLTISEGKGKDDLNMFRPWKPDEAASISRISEQYYNQFVDVVVKSRPKITREDLVDKYGAEIYISSEALELGYIDGTNRTASDTLQQLVDVVGIADDNYQVVGLESRNWLELLFQGKHPFLEGKVVHQIANLPSKFHPDLQGHFLYLYAP